MTSRLALAESVRGDVLAHAAAGARDPAGPREVCGVLVGERNDAGRSRVVDAVRVPNVADDPRTAYELDPVATLAAIESAERDGRDLVGFYHSHPESAPLPSAADRARATWTGYVYLIASPATDELRAWRWSGEAFDPVAVEGP
ncbi:desampylase [Halegenticoccus tardaugens]|uniref:desampylase n=1 Tax=Halegenticoccus tardaugens TaxID=2071624 RepID=UPI001E466AE8|nr:desampylase [Halegenticoccus tardaugens]